MHGPCIRILRTERRERQQELTGKRRTTAVTALISPENGNRRSKTFTTVKTRMMMAVQGVHSTRSSLYKAELLKARARSTYRRKRVTAEIEELPCFSVVFFQGNPTATSAMVSAVYTHEKGRRREAATRRSRARTAGTAARKSRLPEKEKEVAANLPVRLITFAGDEKGSRNSLCCCCSSVMQGSVQSPETRWGGATAVYSSNRKPRKGTGRRSRSHQDSMWEMVFRLPGRTRGTREREMELRWR